ncbi:NUDIX domain-containing protein [Candidatus Uhrbacteria bacterium]|nr:MAG: NUDIX domain-containing protein [Candidatus Uhrbacteria bacterium]
MAKEKYHVSLKAIIVRPDGKVLGLNGKIGGALEGYYDIPGGRIEVDEFEMPLAEILQREIKEETGGLEVELEHRPVALGRHQTWDTDKQRIFYIAFVGRLKENIETVQVSSEHEGYAWLNVTHETAETYFTNGTLELVNGYLDSL